MNAQAVPRLRVLAVAKREPWPLNSGGTLRLYHLLANLAGHADVTLALPHAPRFRSQLPASWRIVTMGGGRTADERSAATERPARRPAATIGWLAQRHFGYDRQIAGWLRRHARPGRYDVVFLYGAVLGVYAEDMGVPFVWDPADDLVLYNLRDGFQRGPRGWLSALRRAALYALYERYVGRHAHATLFCSPVDAAYARRWMGPARVEVVRTCVDTNYYFPSGQAPEPGTVVFVGTLSFPPNVDGIVHFATRVWPAIYGAGPNRRLLIVGKNPVEPLRNLGSRPGVQVIGEVPDVRPYVARAAAVVAPTRTGGGVKNKVLQACAMARPVVASPRAIAGLTVRPGVEILVAARPARWIQQVCRLLTDPLWAERVGQAGYRWVRHAHSWPDAARCLAGVLRSAWMSGGRSRWHRRLACERPLTDAGRKAALACTAQPASRWRAPEEVLCR